MKKEYAATAFIRASAEKVWDILTDGSGYVNWNPEIKRVDGPIRLGEKIKAHVVLHGGKIQPVTVRVTEFESLKRMVWTGGLPFGLFVGRRTFIVAANDDGIVEFTMRINFSGPFSTPIAKSLGDRQPDIDAFAAGLTAWAERDHA